MLGENTILTSTLAFLKSCVEHAKNEAARKAWNSDEKMDVKMVSLDLPIWAHCSLVTIVVPFKQVSRDKAFFVFAFPLLPLHLLNTSHTFC